MGFEFQDKTSDARYTGRDLELVIDEDTDVGEVYLDGNLIFQSDDIFEEEPLKAAFKRSFEVIHAVPENEHSDSMEEDESDYDLDMDMGYDDVGLQERLYTSGGEYATENGREFIGDYHIHPKEGAMIGKYHGEKKHGHLMQIGLEEAQAIRHEGKPVERFIDYTVDEIGPDYE
tara:strand:+ start:2367 stop:2888 length:522 start_codon:yes stop_codon:yes gene_type:complete